nr:Chain C, PHE-VAL-LYS-LYS-LYS-TYR-CYS-LEU [Human immunodeficiency virus 1]
FVKKKYCL